MGMIINIDKALELRSDYNVLREPLNDMLMAQQEAWEKKNPIDLLFHRGSISTFQETYTSSIGFDHAFAETSDYNIGPIFNTAEGFSATYRTRTFQGSFIITKQTLEDGRVGQVKDDATAFVKRWHADQVEYAMKAVEGGFGTVVEYDSGNGKSRIKLESADTSTGAIDDPVKNPLFYKEHTTVKRGDANPVKQSNIFYANIDKNNVAALADVINQVITKMENYRDDNGKRAGVNGSKVIVAPNDAHLKAALNTALSMEMFENGDGKYLNSGYKRATVEDTPYLLDIAPCADGKGFFIIDRAYNASNHGLEFTERVPFTLDVIEEKRPAGIIYDGRQRFDINVASWRGIAYVHIAPTAPTFLTADKYEEITPLAVTAKAVTVVGTVTTKEEA